MERQVFHCVLQIQPNSSRFYNSRSKYTIMKLEVSRIVVEIRQGQALVLVFRIADI